MQPQGKNSHENACAAAPRQSQTGKRSKNLVVAHAIVVAHGKAQFETAEVLPKKSRIRS